jgi:hypothetical protein
MSNARAAVSSTLVVVMAGAAVSACVVRTYEPGPYYRRQPARGYYAQSPSPGAYGGAAYGQPAPTAYQPPPSYPPGAMGGAGYGAPPQPQFPAGAVGGASYGAAAQPQAAPASVYATPAQPQYQPAPTAAPVYASQGTVYNPATPQYAPPPPAPYGRPLVTIQVAPGVAAAPAGAIWVPADRPEPVWAPQALAPGQWYVIEATGVFSCWADHGDGVDAYYGYGPWAVGPQPQPWAQLLVDDRPMYTLAQGGRAPVGYRPDHRYSTMIVGNGSRPKLQIADARNGSWSDNHGGLWVRIVPAQRRY